MHKVQDILRLSYEAHLSGRSIARSLSISRDAVSDTLTRAKHAGLTWPLPDGLDAFELEALLYPPSPGHKKGYPEPNWNSVFHEMRRKGVTLLLLWVEYKTAHPDGCQANTVSERAATASVGVKCQSDSLCSYGLNKHSVANKARRKVYEIGHTLTSLFSSLCPDRLCRSELFVFLQMVRLPMPKM